MAKKSAIDDMLKRADYLFCRFFDEKWWIIFLGGVFILVFYLLFKR